MDFSIWGRIMVLHQPPLRQAALVSILTILGAGCAKPIPEVHLGSRQSTTISSFVTPRLLQSLAILDVRVQCTVPEGVTEDFQLPITERIEGAFLTTGRFEVVERNRLHAVQLELAQTLDDVWFDQANISKLGKFLGARYIALPSARVEVGVFSTNIGLHIKVVDVETATTVETIEAKTSSVSASVTSSLTACLEKLQGALVNSLRFVYPARAQVVRVGMDGKVLAETKLPRSFKTGEKVRLMKNEEILSLAREGAVPFLIEAGRGRVDAVEPNGIVVKTNDRVEEGWIVEAIR